MAEADVCSANVVVTLASVQGYVPENCQVVPLSLCHHKPYNCTAMLNVLDFRCSDAWVPATLIAHNVACFARLCS